MLLVVEQLLFFGDSNLNRARLSDARDVVHRCEAREPRPRGRTGYCRSPRAIAVPSSAVALRAASFTTTPRPSNEPAWLWTTFTRGSRAAAQTTSPPEKPEPHRPMRAVSHIGSPWSQWMALRQSVPKSSGSTTSRTSLTSAVNLPSALSFGAGKQNGVRPQRSGGSAPAMRHQYRGQLLAGLRLEREGDAVHARALADDANAADVEAGGRLLCESESAAGRESRCRRVRALRAGYHERYFGWGTIPVME